MDIDIQAPAQHDGQYKTIILTNKDEAT